MRRDIKYQIKNQSNKSKPIFIIVFLNDKIGLIRFNSDMVINFLIAIICHKIIEYQNNSVKIVNIHIFQIRVAIELCHKNNNNTAQYLISPDHKNQFSL